MQGEISLADVDRRLRELEAQIGRPTPEEDNPCAGMPMVGIVAPYAAPLFSHRLDFESVSDVVSEENFALGKRNLQTIAQEGWLFCDGQRYDPFDLQLQCLASRIGQQWGRGDYGPSLQWFSVPDLQGFFLRGLDNYLLQRDQDGLGRHRLHPGGATGVRIGSYQEDGVGTHSHPFQRKRAHDGVAITSSSARGIEANNPHEGARTGGNDEATADSRPMNAAVHFIIRASYSPIDLDSLQYVDEE